VDRRVEVPTKAIVFLENFGPLFDTSAIVEDELEGGRRTSLDKTDRYFYIPALSVLRDNGRLYIPFK
jgi:hypothetical protein